MATDARKGKTYTKFARLIEIAAREGGGDTTSNIRLRTLIDSAKAESVPNANIERAIKKGTGELKGDAMQEVTYEAYGPGGSAFIIECLTDNKNRTLSAVKLILSKNGGRFAESGSVAWMFERTGLVLADIQAVAWSDELELSLIDAGADDVQRDGSDVRITSSLHSWTGIRDLLQGKGATIASAGLAYIPKQTAPVSGEDLARVQTLIDALEEDEDISEVHGNVVDMAHSL